MFTEFRIGAVRPACGIGGLEGKAALLSSVERPGEGAKGCALTHLLAERGSKTLTSHC